VQTIHAELENGGTLLSQGASSHPGGWTSQPWFALALRVLGITLLMTGLAAIGAVSILSGVQHGEVLNESAATRADVAAAWLAVSREMDHPADRRGGADAPPLPSSSAVPPSEQSPAASAGVTKDGKVVLNLATAEELTQLPGVGVKRAAAIVELRERLGRFKRSSDLLRVRGIGPKSLQKMKPYFVLDAPDATSDDKKRPRREKRLDQASD
jgi:comEA protein